MSMKIVFNIKIPMTLNIYPNMNIIKINNMEENNNEKSI